MFVCLYSCRKVLEGVHLQKLYATGNKYCMSLLLVIICLTNVRLYADRLKSSLSFYAFLLDFAVVIDIAVSGRSLRQRKLLM